MPTSLRDAPAGALIEKTIKTLVGLLILLIPLENVIRIVRGTQEISGPKIAGVLTMGLAAPYLASGKAFRVPPAPLFVLCGWILWCAASVIWSMDARLTLTEIPTLFLGFGYVLLVWFFGKRRPTIVFWMKAMLWGVAICLCSTYYDFIYTKTFVGEYRYTGAGMNQNQLAGILAISVYIAHFLYLDTYSGALSMRAAKIQRACLWAIMFAASLAVILTGSRSGTVALCFTILVVMAQQFQRLRQLALWLFLMASAGFLIKTVAPTVLLSRVTEGTHSHTFVVRELLWAEGLAAWKDEPILGIGYGCYPLVTNMSGGYAHNTFINVLVETGIIGCMLFVGFLLAMGADTLRKAPAKDMKFCVGLLLIWLVEQLADSGHYIKITWFVYALITAMTYTSAKGGQGSSEAES